MFRKLTLTVLAVSLLVSMAACGRDPGTRALTGGLIGAGGGALIGGAAGGHAATGALIGGAAGAVGGAATAH